MFTNCEQGPGKAASSYTSPRKTKLNINSNEDGLWDNDLFEDDTRVDDQSLNTESKMDVDNIMPRKLLQLIFMTISLILMMIYQIILLLKLMLANLINKSFHFFRRVHSFMQRQLYWLHCMPEGAACAAKEMLAKFVRPCENYSNSTENSMLESHQSLLNLKDSTPSKVFQSHLRINKYKKSIDWDKILRHGNPM